MSELHISRELGTVSYNAAEEEPALPPSGWWCRSINQPLGIFRVKIKTRWEVKS